MNQTPEQLIGSLKETQLSQSERDTMRAKLHAFSIANPVRTNRFWALVTRHAFLYSALALLVLVGGTTVLAQQSQPGNPLYSVKLEVNDPVAVVLAGDEDAQLQKELEQVDRSIREEDQAASEELDQESEDELQEDLTADADKQSDQRDQKRDQKSEKEGNENKQHGNRPSPGNIF